MFEVVSLMYEAWDKKEIDFKSLISLGNEMRGIFGMWSNLSIEDLEVMLSIRAFHTIGLLEDISRSVVDLANSRSPLLEAEKSYAIADAAEKKPQPSSNHSLWPWVRARRW